MAALVVAFVPAGARAQTLDGQVLLSWQDYVADGLESDGLRQRYDLRLFQPFSDALALRLMLRAEQDASGATQLGERRTSTFRQLRPGAELTLRLPVLTGSLLWDEVHDETDLDDGRPAHQRDFERLYGTLTWAPEGLPSLGLTTARQLATDDAGAEVLETRRTARLDLDRHRFRAAAYYDVAELEDQRAGYARDSDGMRAELGWGGAFAANRLQVQVEALGASTRVEERPLAGGDAVLRPVAAAETWQAVDDTPLDSTDQPLAAVPALRDGDLARPAGVPLGPEAPGNRALAASFNRFARVDELRIVARDAQGRPPTSGGPVAWDVYVSPDGVRWSALPLPATTTYDPTLGLWSVRFEQVTTRWLKAVSFFVNTIATEITELEAFERRAFGGSRLLNTELDRGGVTASVTLRPVERFSLAWNALFDVGRERPEGLPEIDSEDRTQTLTATWDPHPAAGLLAQLQSSSSERDDGVDRVEQGYDSAFVNLRLGANPNLFGAVEAGRTEVEAPLERTTTDRITARGYGRMWGTLETTLDAGWSRQESDLGWTIESPSASAMVRAALTRSVQLTAFAQHQRNEVSGLPGSAPVVHDRDTRWWIDLFWRPSNVLGAGARLGGVVSGPESTPTQAYRLEWRPFPGGALTLSALYDENVDPAFDRRSRRLTVAPRWRLNRRLSLGLDHYRMTSSGPGFSSELRSTFASLIWNF